MGIFSPVKFPSTAKSQSILKEQIITAEMPHSILKNFNMILDFIGEEGIKTAGKHGFLPMNKLAEINSRLTEPVKLAHQRPQQRSFPHIQGLYLILRATGMAYTKTVKKSKYLVLDKDLLTCWQNLNPTEQYFTLLEAWFIHGNNEILGEYCQGFPEQLRRVQWFLGRFKQSKTYKPEQTKDAFKYYPEPYNLALMQMFGFVDVKTSPKKIEKFWVIDQVKLTDFGRVMLKAINAIIDQNETDMRIICGAEVPFGEFQEALQPFFPEWTNNLTKPKAEIQHGTYIFKVSLCYDNVWRRIAISSELELDLLSDAILKAYEFDRDHLYEFRYKNRQGRKIEICAPEANEYLNTTDVIIGELELDINDQMTYIFDFGENWKFDVLLEKIDPGNDQAALPSIVESFGEAPAQYDEDDELW